MDVNEQKQSHQVIGNQFEGRERLLIMPDEAKRMEREADAATIKVIETLFGATSNDGDQFSSEDSDEEDSESSSSDEMNV